MSSINHTSAAESKSLSFRIHNANATKYLDTEDDYFDLCTDARIEDKLLHAFLSSKKNGWFYYVQAEYYIRRINIYNPLLIFTLHSADIPQALAKHIDCLGETMKDRIITNVVRRIYESVDLEYFHTSGIYGKIKWFIVEDDTQQT